MSGVPQCRIKRSFRHTPDGPEPTVEVTFPIDDFDARDRFAAFLASAPQPAEAVDLLEVARKTGLRQQLHGVNATDARAMLAAFVAALPAGAVAQGQDAEDAARYRWLREEGRDLAEVLHCVVYIPSNEPNWPKSGIKAMRHTHHMDAAIDAAMLRAGGGK